MSGTWSAMKGCIIFLTGGGKLFMPLLPFLEGLFAVVVVGGVCGFFAFTLLTPKGEIHLCDLR